VSHSPARTPDDDVTKPSAFLLPPSRSADNSLPVPVPARSRDEDRSTKPRIWSLAEVATSSDYRPNRPDHVASPESRHSAEFRPWREAENRTLQSAGARLGGWQGAFVSSATSSTRWPQNNADTSVVD